MAKLSEPRTAVQSARLQLVGDCDYCGESAPLMRFARQRGDGRYQTRLQLCVWCLLDAAEQMTGMGFVNQGRNWETLRTLTKQTRKPRTARGGR